MKRTALLIFSSLLCIMFMSCASASYTTMYHLENKRAKGESSKLIYHENWEKVYDSYRTVFRYGTNYDIPDAFPQIYSCLFEFAKEDQVILLRGEWPNLFMAIFFQQKHNETIVEFVGDIDIPQKFVNLVNEEYLYYVTHGRTAYLKYSDAKLTKKIQDKLK